MYYEYLNKTEKECSVIFLESFTGVYRSYLRRYFGIGISRSNIPDFKVILKFRDHADFCLMKYCDYWDIVLFRYARELGCSFREIFNCPDQIRLFVSYSAWSKLEIFRGREKDKAYWDWVFAYYERHFSRDDAFDSLLRWTRDGYLSLLYFREEISDFAREFYECVFCRNDSVHCGKGICYEDALAVVKSVDEELGWSMDVVKYNADFDNVSGLYEKMGIKTDGFNHDHAVMYIQIAGLSGAEYAREAVVEQKISLLAGFGLSRDDARLIQHRLGSGR